MRPAPDTLPTTDTVQTYDARRHPAQLVRRVHQMAAGLFTQNVKTPHLSATQFVALVTLLKEGPMAQSLLGRETSMDPSTTTMVVRKLEKAGMIEKSRSATDLRTTIIALTDAGQQCALEHIPVSIGAGQDLLAPLTDIEADLFVAILQKILSHAQDK